LNAFTRNIRIARRFPTRDLIDLVEKDNSGVLGLLNCRSRDLLHVGEPFLFIADQVNQRLAEFHFSPHGLCRKQVAKHVAKIHAHLFHALSADEIDRGISAVLCVDLDQAIIKLAAPKLLALMGGSPELVATGWKFTAIMLGGNVVIMLLFLINAIFRGAGDAAIAMRVLWFANILNIVLGPCFIFGLGPFPKLGVTGAAVATTIGRGSGVLFQLWTLGRGRGRVVIRRRHLKLDPAVMLRMLRLSGNAMFQVLIGTASWIGLVRIISGFGSAALAGYTIGIRIIVFALLPSWGMSNAAATMVGQSLGAGKPDRAERSVWIAGFYNMIFLGVVGLGFVAGAPALVSLFTSDPAVVPYGVACLRYVSYGFLFYAYGMVLTQAFNGAGDTWTPTWLNLFVFWLWEIPLAYVLAKVLGWGPRGVFVAITVAFSTLAVASALLFRRGRWKLKKV